MEVGLAHLIDTTAVAHVEQSRTFNAAAQAAAAGDQPQPPGTGSSPG